MGQGYFHQEPDTKKWSVQFSYKDYYGNTKRKHKRGFTTKRDAKQPIQLCRRHNLRTDQGRLRGVE